LILNLCAIHCTRRQRSLAGDREPVSESICLIRSITTSFCRRKGPRMAIELIDLPPEHPAWDRAIPVLAELRTSRSAEELRQIITDGSAQGLRFGGAFDGERCLGVAGWRVVLNTSDLRKLYFDDLVTTQAAQSSGVGRILLAELRKRAIEHGCFTLELDSGVQRYDAHRFSLRERMNIDAHHFTLQLSTPARVETQTA
jgi:GNAT superfamily N-acetyltransferase